MVQLDLIFARSCYFWRIFHLSLTLQTGSWHFHPLCLSVVVPFVFFISSSFMVSIESQVLVLQLVSPPAQPYV